MLVLFGASAAGHISCREVEKDSAVDRFELECLFDVLRETKSIHRLAPPAKPRLLPR